MRDEAARVVRFLRAGSATLARSAVPDSLLLHRGEGAAAISVSARVIERLVASGLVARNGMALSLVRDGESGDPLGARARAVETLAGDHESPGLVNAAESPLGALARRRAKDGTMFLTPAEFQAGERLRADFTRGSMMPRLSANWTASVSSGRRHGGSGIGDLTDAALAARVRVERALEAAGPELAGVLVDVCCFLKGLEQVESERGWPVRSAKVVLKSGLSALARHYDPGEKTRRSGAVLHWGARDYRPKLR